MIYRTLNFERHPNMKPPQFRFFINTMAASKQYLYHRYNVEDGVVEVCRSCGNYVSKNSLEALINSRHVIEIPFCEAVLITENISLNCNFNNNKDENQILY